MIEITNNLERYVSERVTTKARRCFVRRLAADKFLVTPKEFGKARRLVTFRLRGSLLLAKCEDYRTGEPCPANANHLTCYHAYKAIQHATKLARREEKRAA